MKQKKDDTGKYVKQWNEKLKQELKQSVNAYVELLKKYKQLKAEFNELKKKNKQLETDYKEANESITWWQNRFNAVERDNRNLKNNRDKAIKFGNGLLLGEATFEERHIANRFLNILKGESDE